MRFNAAIISVRFVLLGDPLVCRVFVVVTFDYRHPSFRNCTSIVPIDVIRVHTYLNSLIDLPRVPVVVTSFQSGLCPIVLAYVETVEF